MNVTYRKARKELRLNAKCYYNSRAKVGSYTQGTTKLILPPPPHPTPKKWLSTSIFIKKRTWRTCQTGRLKVQWPTLGNICRLYWRSECITASGISSHKPPAAFDLHFRWHDSHIISTTLSHFLPLSRTYLCCLGAMLRSFYTDTQKQRRKVGSLPILFHPPTVTTTNDKVLTVLKDSRL